jgi:hypothetical protein
MLRLGLALITACLLFSAVQADTLTGELRGQVLDVESGTPLAGVQVDLTNINRGWTRTQRTDQTGRYAFLQLEPGNYTVSTEVVGYYGVTKTDVLIRLNRLKVLLPPFELRPMVTTPTREIVLRGEQAKRAIVDLSAGGPLPVILAVTEESGTTALVSLGDGSLRFNFDSHLLGVLPLRGGRSYDQLALFAPGVFRAPFSSGRGPAVGLGVGSPGQFSVNGLRGRSNSYTVDGSDNNDEDIGMRRQGFVMEVSQNLESIEEFQIMTGGFPAEFGKTGGSIVNAVSRSGQSRVHGEFTVAGSHDSLTSRGFFDRPFQDTVNQGSLSGGTFEDDQSRTVLVNGAVGGPLGEKTFLLGSGGRIHHSARRVGHFLVPTLQERGLRTSQGLIPIDQLGGFFANRGIPYASTAGEGVFELYPLANHPAGPFGDSTYSQARSAEDDGYSASVKADRYWTDATSLSVRYNLTDDSSLIPFTSDALESSLATDTRTQNLSIFLNSTWANWANAARLSFGRSSSTFPPEKGSRLLFGSSPVDGLPGGADQVIRTEFGDFGPFGATGPVGRLVIHPFSPIGIDAFNFPQGRVNNTYQISDFVTLMRDRHTFKFGGEIRRSELRSFNDRNHRPLVEFVPGYVSSTCLQNPTCIFATSDGLLAGTDAAALGAPAGMLQTLSTQDIPDSTLGLVFHRIELFLQDDWRVTPRLVVNLGIRYEYQSVPRDDHDRLARAFGLEADQFPRLDPASFPTAEHQEVVRQGNLAFDRAFAAWKDFLGGRSRIYDPDRNAFSPRFGFAWDPFGDGKSVIRGGYTLAYDGLLGAVTSRSRNVFPTFVPLNIDLNFQPPSGTFLNSPHFFEFEPTGERLITPGTLNRFNLAESGFATALGGLFVQAPPFPGASLSSNGLAFTLPERSLESTYAQHFILAVERQVTRDYLVAARYVGTAARRLTRFETPNAGLIATPALFVSPFFGVVPLDLPPSIDPDQEGRSNQNLGAYNVIGNRAASEYHSLQLSLERRFSQGLQFQAHWTWGHALDHVSDPFDTRSAPALPQSSSRTDLEWASASYDVRHRAVGHLAWEPVDGRLRGWRFGATVETQTGQPYTIASAFDRNLDGNLSDRPNALDGVVQKIDDSPESLRIAPGTDLQGLLANRGRDGSLGRNTFRADGLFLVDLAAGRQFIFRESTRLELRCEVFNLVNNKSFGIPIRTLESPGFGRSFDLQSEPRQLRLQLRLLF